MTKVDDFEGLMKAAAKARLGDDLVVQTAYGDSGRTTFFTWLRVSPQSTLAGARDWQ